LATHKAFKTLINVGKKYQQGPMDDWNDVITSPN
jgi:hypothetical protein